jgi:hypothetical protein
MRVLEKRLRNCTELLKRAVQQWRPFLALAS